MYYMHTQYIPHACVISLYPHDNFSNCLMVDYNIIMCMQALRGRYHVNTDGRQLYTLLHHWAGVTKITVPLFFEFILSLRRSLSTGRIWMDGWMDKNHQNNCSNPPPTLDLCTEG